MTSNVKSWPPIFYLFFLSSTGVLGRAGARKTRRVILRLSVGCVPPAWRSSGALPRSRDEGSCRLCTPLRATPHLGCVSADGRRKHSEHWGTAANGRCRGCPWHVLGTRPQKRPEFPRHGHDHWVGGVCSRVLRGRSRVPRRTWVCQRRSWMGFVPFARHFVVRERESPSPQGPAFIDKDAMHPGGLQLTETVSESTGWGPMWPGATTSAWWAWATEATMLDSWWISRPTERVRAWCLADLRNGFRFRSEAVQTLGDSVDDRRRPSHPESSRALVK